MLRGESACSSGLRRRGSLAGSVRRLGGGVHLGRIRLWRESSSKRVGRFVHRRGAERRALTRRQGKSERVARPHFAPTLHHFAHGLAIWFRDLGAVMRRGIAA